LLEEGRSTGLLAEARGREGKVRKEKKQKIRIKIEVNVKYI